jgi:hypothetical protein
LIRSHGPTRGRRSPRSFSSSSIGWGTLSSISCSSTSASVSTDETSSLEVWSSPTSPSLGIGRYGALLGAECGSSTTWKTVLHFGQTIGSRLRSKNAAPQLRHRRFAPSSAFATAFSSSEIVYAIYRDRAGFGPASASEDRSLRAPGLVGGLDPSSAPSPPPVHPRSTETGETEFRIYA